MSPVYEGSIAVLTGERVIVSANDFVKGVNITEKDIEGRDYTGVNNLYIFPDAGSATSKECASPSNLTQIPNTKLQTLCEYKRAVQITTA